MYKYVLKSKDFVVISRKWYSTEKAALRSGTNKRDVLISKRIQVYKQVELIRKAG